MTTWDAGYVTDVSYTYGYYAELNPLRLKLAAVSASVESPRISTVCELGFGQGVSILMHAATQANVEYWGTDFNPQQAAFARKLADHCQLNCKLFDQSFEEFCSRTDLPEFDFIGLHGIWSWISDKNRDVVAEFLRKKLRVGGALYISYNTLPGWAAAMPLRHLLTQHAEEIGSKTQGSLGRVDGAMVFLDQFLAVKPAYLKSNPQVTTRVQKMKEHERAYLAHEYFNKDWKPMHYAEMAEYLELSKLSFVCSADPINHIDALNFLPEQIELLKGIPSGKFKETVRDMLVNQQFRRDYWVKGVLPLHEFSNEERIKGLRVVLVAPKATVTMKANCALGEATLHSEVYETILTVLSDHAVHGIDDLARGVNKLLPQTIRQIFEALMILVSKGVVCVAQEDEAIVSATASAEKLNRFLLQQSKVNGPIGYLASPVTGGAISVSSIDQLFILAMLELETSHAETILDFVANSLLRQKRLLLEDGQPITNVERSRQKLQALFQDLTVNRLLMFQQLKLIPTL